MKTPEHNRTFNSTRCIRNWLTILKTIKVNNLSTPHGALGTESDEEDIEEKLSLSTPHGALGTPHNINPSSRGKPLSTPHGALGTHLYRRDYAIV